jgi:hypothetical protein
MAYIGITPATRSNLESMSHVSPVAFIHLLLIRPSLDGVYHGTAMSLCSSIRASFHLSFNPFGDFHLQFNIYFTYQAETCYLHVSYLQASQSYGKIHSDLFNWKFAS